jgi:hypothetical protein
MTIFAWMPGCGFGCLSFQWLIRHLDAGCGLGCGIQIGIHKIVWMRVWMPIVTAKIALLGPLYGTPTSTRSGPDEHPTQHLSHEDPSTILE